MTVAPGTETCDRPLSPPVPALRRNSPLPYGLGTLGLSAVAHAFGGYYMFYYMDVLSLTVALGARGTTTNGE